MKKKKIILFNHCTVRRKYKNLSKWITDIKKMIRIVTHTFIYKHTW